MTQATLDMKCGAGMGQHGSLVSRPLNTLKNYEGPPVLCLCVDLSFNSHCIKMKTVGTSLAVE